MWIFGLEIFIQIRHCSKTEILTLKNTTFWGNVSENMINVKTASRVTK